MAPAKVTRETAEYDQRRRIVRATGELIGKRGYDGVTVELIVKRARVSFKTFYKHFSNKEEAFLLLFDSVSAIATETITDAVAEAGESWPRQVDAAIRALLDLVASEPAIARACIVDSLAAGPVFVARAEQALKGLTLLLRGGRAHNPHKEKLPQTLEDTVVGGMMWIVYHRLVIGDIEALQASSSEILEFALRPYVGPAEARDMAAELSPEPTASR
jgi:AcrR family transcriptional regulator